MSAFNLTPGHIRQPVSVWRGRWVELPNYLFEQHTRLIPALRHINASKAGEGQQLLGRTHRCGMDTPNSHLPIIYAKVVFQNRSKTLIDVYTHRNNFIRSGPNLNFMNLPSICYEQIFRIRRNRVSSFRREAYVLGIAAIITPSR